MRRAHVEWIVCGAMMVVACNGSANRYGGFSTGPDASSGFPTGLASDSGSGGYGPRDAATAEDGGAGANAAVCGNCTTYDVCCSDPSSIDYGHCYSPMCVGCCQSGSDAGSCVAGASCGSNESCCAKPGSVGYGLCFPKACAGCCPGGAPISDGGADAGICGPCIAGTICCATPGALDFGRCYASSCTGCCQ